MIRREDLEKAITEQAAAINIKVKYAVISTQVINFSEDLLKACQANVCGMYNASWACPPATGSVKSQKEKITSFGSAFVFSTVSGLEDSFDYEGMMRARDSHNRLTSEMHKKFGGGNLVYGAGGCTICKVCAYPEPCRYPESIFPSLEAAGINVTELSRAGGLRYNNGENTVTYFSIILF